MYRRLLLLFILVLLMLGCAAPGRVKSSANLFPDINTNYPFSQYNFVLKTKDRLVFLTDPKLVNGEIHAEYSGVQPAGKKLVFYTKENAAQAFERLTDSSGKPTNHVIVRKAGIVKVKVHDRFRGFDRRVVYDKDWTLHKILLVLVFTVALALVGVGVYYVIYTLLQAAAAVAGFCYIATMVYKSYDAPEVLVLRKFRDEKLKPYFFGRLFIGLYYSLSPYFVAVFRNNKTVNNFCRSVLDRCVSRLIRQTASATPALSHHP